MAKGLGLGLLSSPFQEQLFGLPSRTQLYKKQTEGFRGEGGGGMG